MSDISHTSKHHKHSKKLEQIYQRESFNDPLVCLLVFFHSFRYGLTFLHFFPMQHEMEFVLSTRINEHDSLVINSSYQPLDSLQEDNYIQLQQQQQSLSIFANAQSQKTPVEFTPQKHSE